MKNSFAAPDEVIVRANERSLGANDVPEAIEHDPFEDDLTGEIVLLDVVRLHIAEVEVLP